MYLEIKNKKFILPLLGIYFINISFIYGQEPKDIPIYLSKSIYLKPEEVEYKRINEDVTKKQYRLLQNSSVFRAHINTNLIDPSLQKNNLNSNIQIRKNKNIAGKYLFAWHPKSSKLNERNTIVIKSKKNIKILMRQIAGTVARRIKCYIKKGDKVNQCEEFGFIKFGSRVDLFLPLDFKLNIKLGDKTHAGITKIGKF